MSITHPRREITFLRVGREERDRGTGDLLAASTIRAAAKLWRGGGCLSTLGRWRFSGLISDSCSTVVEWKWWRTVKTEGFLLSEIMDASVPIHLRG